MSKILLIVMLSISLFANDIIVKQSNCSVDKTVQNIKNIVTKKGLHVFTVIDHSKNAKTVNMKLNESKLIIFGNPTVGTALMQQDLTVGLDLPIKILVFRDENGEVEMAYRDGSWLNTQHTLNANKKIETMNKALDKITTKAGQCTKD
jgi:uncharacterized protein (DUF302 family)